MQGNQIKTSCYKESKQTKSITVQHEPITFVESMSVLKERVLTLCTQFSYVIVISPLFCLAQNLHHKNLSDLSANACVLSLSAKLIIGVKKGIFHKTNRREYVATLTCSTI